MKSEVARTYFVILLLVAIGCDAGQRQSLQGTVTLDDKPLETGVIQFLPIDGTKGQSAGSEITNGAFTASMRKGTFAGKYRVEITSVRKTGKQMPVAGGGTTDEMRNIIPAKYNQESQLIYDASTTGTCDFKLTSS